MLDNRGLGAQPASSPLPPRGSSNSANVGERSIELCSEFCFETEGVANGITGGGWLKNELMKVYSAVPLSRRTRIKDRRSASMGSF